MLTFADSRREGDFGRQSNARSFETCRRWFWHWALDARAQRGWAPVASARASAAPGRRALGTRPYLPRQCRHQFAGVDFQRSSNLDDVVKRDVDLAAFDLTEVGPVEVASVSKGLLAQLEQMSPFADASSELFRRCGQRRFSGGSWHDPSRQASRIFIQSGFIPTIFVLTASDIGSG